MGFPTATAAMHEQEILLSFQAMLTYLDSANLQEASGRQGIIAKLSWGTRQVIFQNFLLSYYSGWISVSGMAADSVAHGVSYSAGVST